jgi:hypothetical protein
VRESLNETNIGQSRIGKALHRIGEIFLGVRRPRAADWDGTAEGIRAGASFLAQGSIYSYLRARTLLAGPKLFDNDDFIFALEICKWEAFASAAQDLIIILEGDMREMDLGDRTELPETLMALYEATLDLEQIPDHRTESGWGDLVARFRPRIMEAVNNPPRTADEISPGTARIIMQHAPVEDPIRVSDLPMVQNNLAFRFVDYKRRMRRDFDYPAIAAAIARHSAARAQHEAVRG